MAGRTIRRKDRANALGLMPTAMYCKKTTIRYLGGSIGMETGMVILSFNPQRNLPFLSELRKSICFQGD
ncbi:MAG: hypothetical protein K4305_03685 [Chlorobium sp.]|uniref:hypothetical protein n=1 Tax=Chlorobium sp. TaxID=1095 RepID=UPI002F40783E